MPCSRLQHQQSPVSRNARPPPRNLTFAHFSPATLEPAATLRPSIEQQAQDARSYNIDTLSDELEMMALNAAEERLDEPTALTPGTISRWQALFGYFRAGAIDLIERHRSNISRRRVDHEHWEIVRSRYEARGYDKEAYEHELGSGGCRMSEPVDECIAADTGRYLVKLEGSVTPGAIQHACEMVQVPDITVGSGDDGMAYFCQIDAVGKQALLDTFSSTGFKPTIIRLVDPAKKELSRTSKYPTLGVDTTLPQHRADSPADCLPAQNQFPVWYFFYGTLADPTVLIRHLGLQEPPILHAATIHCGTLKSWSGKYRALVDAPEDSSVSGSAFEVVSKTHEDALRAYETASYEVVRCVIEVEGQGVPGCTFRFVGTPDS